MHPAAVALAAYEGVQLFVERARAADPDFALTEEQAGAVARICVRLDGIPLAIELAAARAGSLPVEAIAARLDQSIGLLTGGPRDVLPRHRTLRATLDWSWELLGEGERALLRRLSVFAAGWPLGAAVAVCGGDGLEAGAVPELLDRLAARSLVGLDEAAAGARYRLLETLRQYAAEQLAAFAHEAVAVRGRHLAWCVALAEEAAPQLSGPDQGAWLARLEREHDNLRAALALARERAEAELGLRLVGGLWRFWLRRGYLTEGRGWLEGALVSGGQGLDALRARALIGAGVLAGQQGDHERAAFLFEEALTLYRARGDTQGSADALHNLGIVAKMRRDYRRAATLHEEALALRRTLGDSIGVAASLTNLGIVAYRQGEYRRAAALHEEALALYRALGDTQGTAGSLGNLGNVVHLRGDHLLSTALHEEALALERALGDKIGIATSLHNLGLVTYERGDYGRLDALLGEGLLLSRDLGVRELLAEGLELAAWVVAVRGEMGTAASLGGAAEALRDMLGISLPPGYLANHNRTGHALQVALGAGAFTAAWAEGRALSLEQAIAKALAGRAGA